MSSPQRRGTLGTITDLRLIPYDPRFPSNKYQHQYIPVTPNNPPSLSASEGEQPGDSETQLWKMDKWGGGEGLSSWEPGTNQYFVSSGVRPVRINDGIELGASTAKTVANGGGAFNGGQVLGVGQGKVWTAKDTTLYSWDESTGQWDAGQAIGSAQTVVSIAEPGDGYVYVGLADSSIRQIDPGVGNASWCTSLGGYPYLVAFGGTLYALIGDDLYEIDLTVSETTTLRADTTGSSTVWRTGTTPWDRIATSERGPIWLQRLDNGETLVWEYNVYADAQTRLTKLPVSYAWPYSIRYEAGFVFVGFRYATATANSGAAYVYYARGAQTGVLGPARSLSGSTSGKTVRLAGSIGEQIIFVYDGAVWGYTPSDGGLSMVGLLTTNSGAPINAVTFGSQVFVSGLNDGTSGVVDRLDLDAYTTTGTLDSGSWDFWYPGLQKLMLEVTVWTDALPASTSVGLSVSKDGGSFASVTGSHSTTAATKYTWTVSTTSTTVAAKEFAVRLTLNGTSSATPTVRAVVVRAGSGAFVEQWILPVDCNNSKVGRQSSDVVIDALNALTTAGPISFVDVWQNRGRDAGDTTTVQVREVVTPTAESDSPSVAQVRIRATSLIEVT